MKSCLIVNPASGTDSAPAFLPLINERLNATFNLWNVLTTEKAGDAKQFAADAVRAGCTHIFVAGGDGTLNEVLNGVANEANGLAQITFGVIPLGTGNDFANAALGLPENVEETLEFLSRNNAIEVDVGKVNNNYFVNVSAGGFIAEVSEAVDPTLKTIAGKLAYVIGGAQVLFDFNSVKTEMRLRYASGEVYQRRYDVQMFAVCNSKMLGGGRLIAPDAIINDGLLDVYIFEADSTFEFLGLLAQVASGEHLGDENVRYFRAEAVEFEFEREVKVNVDGEVLDVQSCHYNVLPRAARFLVGEPSLQA